MARGEKANRKVNVLTTMRDFTILSKIGDGAYSEVYKVKRLSDG